MNFRHLEFDAVWFSDATVSEELVTSLLSTEELTSLEV